MKFKKNIKKGLKITLGIAALNQGLVASGDVIGLTLYKAFKKKITISADMLQSYKSLPVDYGVLNYLFLANSIVNTKAKEGSDCKDYSIATYETYLNLINLNGREDLEDKVRITAGIYEDLSHVMLEFKDSNTIKPYETTWDVPLLPIDKVKEFTEKYNETDIKKIEIPFIRTAWGGNLFYPTLDSFLFLGGEARIVFITLTSE